MNLPHTARLSKRKILPYTTGNLQWSGTKPTSTNEECGILPRRGKNLFRFQSIGDRAEMSCGTPPTGKLRGWVIVSYIPKGQWLILCCCPIIGRGITDFLQRLQILVILHRAWDRSRLPEIMSCLPNKPREGRRFFFLRPFTFQERSDEMEKCLIVVFWLSVFLSNFLFFNFLHLPGKY